MVGLKFSLCYDILFFKLYVKNDEFCLGDFWLEILGNFYVVIISLRNVKNWVWERNVVFSLSNIFIVIVFCF